MREYLQWCLNCLDKDILIDGEIKFVDNDIDIENSELMDMSNPGK